MTTELRKTGISVVGDVPWGTHLCHFYETKQDLLDNLVPYFKAGLESKEFCLWVVSSSELITMEEARGALSEAVPDLDRHLSDKNIEILNGPEWYLEENAFNLERVAGVWVARLKRALALGYEGMRVSGDTFWLEEKDWKDFCTYEKQFNDAITDLPMTALCTYPLSKSGAAEILDVVQTHQFAIARRQGEWEVLETPQLRQAKAEIKRLNEELEQRVIERTSELRESEQRFLQLAENSREVFWMTTADWSNTLYISPAYEAVWGRSCASLYQDPRSFIVTRHDIQPVSVRLFPGWVLRLSASFPLISDPLRTVLAVKGSLRRAKCRRALDCSGPLWNVSRHEGKGGLWNPRGLNVTKSPENIAEDYTLSLRFTLKTPPVWLT